MSKKPQQKHSAKTPKRIPDLQLAHPFQLDPKRRKIATAIIAFLPIVAGLIYALPMQGAIGTNGFPLDDPWIHLQFARNLVDHGSFSYFENSMATSGSTSPAYTFLLALLFLIVKNEFVISYALGILFFALSAMLFYRVARVMFELEEWIALLVSIAFVLCLKVTSIALSGMETTMFIFVLLAAVYAYGTKRFVLLAISAGAVLWTRPDGVILLIALLIHFLLQTYLPRREKKPARETRAFDPRSLFTPGIILFILIAGYLTFNLALSGSIFPNTMAAKIKYYGGGSQPQFFNDMLRFYSSSELGVFIFFAALSIPITLWRALKREVHFAVVPMLFLLGMVAAYWIKIPFLYQDGRYLIPTLPFFLLLGTKGMRDFFEGALRLLPSPAVKKLGNRATVLLFIVAAIVSGANWNAKRNDHYSMVKYIHDRQVVTAQWIDKNTPANAVIGTHDIGAIAFYGKRKIVDMVGLVSPEMIEHIGDLQYLTKYLERQRVTHLALLRNWFEVTNQNPIFKTDERTPEIMEVFPYRRGVTHLMPQMASAMNGQAAYLMQRGQYIDAFRYLEQSYKADPQSVRTLSLLGLAAIALGDTTRGIQALESALSMQNDFVPGIVPLAKIYGLRKNYNHAIGLLQFALTIDPTSQDGQEALRGIMMARRDDSLAALGMTRKRMSIPLTQ